MTLTQHALSVEQGYYNVLKASKFRFSSKQSKESRKLPEYPDQVFSGNGSRN